MAILKRRRGRKALSTGSLQVRSSLGAGGAEDYRLSLVGGPHTYDLALDRLEAGNLLSRLAIAMAGPSFRDGQLARPGGAEALRLLVNRLDSGRGI